MGGLSPNIRDLTAAALYPAIGLLEGTNVPVGGTAEPFHIVGAVIDGRPVIVLRPAPPMKYEAVEFTLNDRRHPYAGQTCNGIRVLVESADTVRPRSQWSLIRALRSMYPKQWEFQTGRAARAPVIAGRDRGSLEELRLCGSRIRILRGPRQVSIVLPGNGRRRQTSTLHILGF
jgi:uncharacterized protein YbbC (DUF1343 family)